jgi:hypothetical protein
VTCHLGFVDCCIKLVGYNPEVTHNHSCNCRITDNISHSYAAIWREKVILNPKNRQPVYLHFTLRTDQLHFTKPNDSGFSKLIKAENYSIFIMII